MNKRNQARVMKKVIDNINKKHGSVEHYFYLQEKEHEANRKSVIKQALLWEKIKTREHKE